MKRLLYSLLVVTSRCLPSECNLDNIPPENIIKSNPDASMPNEGLVDKVLCLLSESKNCKSSNDLEKLNTPADSSIDKLFQERSNRIQSRNSNRPRRKSINPMEADKGFYNGDISLPIDDIVPHTRRSSGGIRSHYNEERLIPARRRSTIPLEDNQSYYDGDISLPIEEHAPYKIRKTAPSTAEKGHYDDNSLPIENHMPYKIRRTAPVAAEKSYYDQGMPSPQKRRRILEKGRANRCSDEQFKNYISNLLDKRYQPNANANNCTGKLLNSLEAIRKGTDSGHEDGTCNDEAYRGDGPACNSSYEVLEEPVDSLLDTQPESTHFKPDLGSGSHVYEPSERIQGNQYLEHQHFENEPQVMPHNHEFEDARQNIKYPEQPARAEPKKNLVEVKCMCIDDGTGFKNCNCNKEK